METGQPSAAQRLLHLVLGHAARSSQGQPCTLSVASEYFSDRGLHWFVFSHYRMQPGGEVSANLSSLTVSPERIEQMLTDIEAWSERVCKRTAGCQTGQRPEQDLLASTTPYTVVGTVERN
ncbi:MAG: hypothetical protein U0821_18680 [Chloroflexota bacterium]